MKHLASALVFALLAAVLGCSNENQPSAAKATPEARAAESRATQAGGPQPPASPAAAAPGPAALGARSGAVPPAGAGAGDVPPALAAAPPQDPAPIPAPGASAGAVGGTSSNPLRAPGEYVEAVVGAKGHAMTVAALAAMRQRIAAFETINDRFPSALSELEKDGPLNPLPVNLVYTYNPATGALDVAAAK